MKNKTPKPRVMWADDYTAELICLRAEVERWKTVAATMSEEREHNANEASRLRAEVERLSAANAFRSATPSTSR